MAFSQLDRALALRATPLFAALTAHELMPVASVATEHALAADEALFHAGELGDAMYVIVEGEVRVLAGPEVVARLGPGECVGEMAALDWEPRSATVVATGATRLIRLGRNELMDLLRDHPAIVRALARLLAARIRAS
jgi:CRP-like cAMP-binding protein